MGEIVNLRYGMVGGGIGSTIGRFHRAALAGEGDAVLSAGCFTRRAEANRRTGAELGVPEDRVYSSFSEMAEKESARGDGIDFVVITTPNATHYEIAKAFLEHGIHVSCEKPLCFTTEQGEELKALARKQGLLFAVTYTYSGCEMTQLARKLIDDGEIGEILNVNAAYFQGWMLENVNRQGNEGGAPAWRLLPEHSGISNCVADIGTHIENTVARMTGLQAKRVAAVLDFYGMELDVNANILVEYENGAHGVYSCSQIYTGQREGLEICIAGTEGTIEWAYRDASRLTVSKRGQEPKIYTSTCAAPDSEPHGEVILALANIYRSFLETLREKKRGEISKENETPAYPAIEDGIAGVKFIYAAVTSSKNHAAWIEI